MKFTETRTRLTVATVATGLTILMLLGYVAFLAYPSTEAVRLRNALLLLEPDPAVGVWTPSSFPISFKQETMPLPEVFTEAAHRVAPNSVGSEADRARALVRHLMERARPEGTGPTGKRLDVVRTYHEITTAGRGYCSDYVDAFVALSLASGIPVRTWAFSFDGFGGHGHVLAEVYDRSVGQWVMLDVFNNVMPVTRSRQSMSVREFLPEFTARESEVEFVPIGPGRLGYPKDAKLRDYYRRGLDQWYLWNGNNVIERGASHLPSMLGRFSQTLGQLAAIAVGDYPGVVPLPTRTNAHLIAELRALRAQLVAVAVVLIVLFLIFAAELVLLLRAHKFAGRL